MPNVKVTKVLQKRSSAAVESFHKSYESIWGEQRWHESLFLALGRPTRYCALLNHFGQRSKVMDVLEIDNTDAVTNAAHEFSIPVSASTHTQAALLVLQNTAKHAFPTPARVPSLEPERQVLSHWNLDLASVLAASMLQVRPGDRVLDLCAAPGGKSIVLAQMLYPEIYANSAPTVDSAISNVPPRSVLHSNEFDQTRHRRLASNLESYLPSVLFADKAVSVLRVDASSKSAVNDLPFGEEGYDKVLVDAPCSSERHIIHAHLRASSGGQVSEEMTNWKSSHSRTLAKTQAALLMTAFKAVRLSGTVVYATCSIATEENDDVIERTLDAVRRERKKITDTQHSAWKIEFDTNVEQVTAGKDLLNNMTEKTKYGRVALPDHPAGGQWGPLYFCVMRKVPYKSKTEVDTDSNE